MSLTQHATMSGFRVGKLDGYWVYSLTDIMAQVDKYGYNNNIICGFNCRHHLIAYRPNDVPPKEYSDQDIKKEREINTKLRAKEDFVEVYDKVMLANYILGLEYDFVTLSDEDKEIYNKWLEYRNNKDFENADKMRAELVDRKII